MDRKYSVLYALWAMARPSQLLAVTLVYLFGIIIALAHEYPYASGAILWGYLALLPAAASIHYANEYSDKDTDALTTRTPFSGGSGALGRTGLDRTLALQAARVSGLLSAFIAYAGFAQGNLHVTVLPILAFGLFFGWIYSLKPLALAWRGLGELDNAALGGVVLPVYGYVVLARQIEMSAVLAVLPFGLLVFANLLAVTWPDRQADAAVGKMTLATRWSPKVLRLLYWATAAAAFLLLPLLSDWVLPRYVAWICMLAVPVVVWGAIVYTRRRSPLPTVAAMVVMLVSHMIGWLISIG